MLGEWFSAPTTFHVLCARIVFLPIMRSRIRVCCLWPKHEEHGTESSGSGVPITAFAGWGVAQFDSWLQSAFISTRRRIGLRPSLGAMLISFQPTQWREVLAIFSSGPFFWFRPNG